MKNRAVHTMVKVLDGYALTRHAWERMGGRSFSPALLCQVLEFGRETYVRGATIYAVGRKEICQYAKEGVDLKGLDGMQVVTRDAGAIITAYRNRDFRGLKATKHTSRHIP